MIAFNDSVSYEKKVGAWWRDEPLGRQFGWLWAAYAVSAYGSGLGFGAFPLIAVLVLHAGPAQVSALSAVGPAVGALIAAAARAWVEFRRKRPVMIAMDLTRFAVMATVPVAYAFGRLSFVQLLVVSAVVAAAKIAFNAASGAYLKALVRPDDLLVAERPVRVHELELDRGRAAPGRGGDRPVRAGHHRGGRCAQLPVLRAGDHRDPRPGGTPAESRRRQGPGSGRAICSTAGGTSCAIPACGRSTSTTCSSSD